MPAASALTMWQHSLSVVWPPRPRSQCRGYSVCRLVNVRDIESGKVRATRELFRVDQDHREQMVAAASANNANSASRAFVYPIRYPPSFRVTPARMRIIIPPNEIPIPLYRW